MSYAGKKILSYSVRFIRLLSHSTCYIQLCSATTILKSRQQIRESLKDASEQFVDDVALIVQTFPNNEFVMEITGEIVSKISFLNVTNFNCLVLLFQPEVMNKEVRKSLKARNETITVQSVKDYLLEVKEQFKQISDKQQSIVDALNRYETTLSTKLPPERYNRLINLLRVFTNVDATSEEIENCLVIRVILILLIFVSSRMRIVSVRLHNLEIIGVLLQYFQNYFYGTSTIQTKPERMYQF